MKGHTLFQGDMIGENKVRCDSGVPVVPVSPGSAGAAGRRHQVSQVPHQRRMDHSSLHGSAKMVQIFETVNRELLYYSITIQSFSYGNHFLQLCFQGLNVYE